MATPNNPAQNPYKPSAKARLLRQAGIRKGEQGDGRTTWSVKQAAKHAGIARQTMINYMEDDLGPTGARPYDPHTLRKVATAFGIPWSRLREAAEEDAGNKVVHLSAEFLDEFRGRLTGLPPDAQLDLARLLEELRGAQAYSVGDQIGLPPEPPIGAVLRGGGDDGYRIDRNTKGWGAVGRGNRVPWHTALCEWGPGRDGAPFEVISLPGK